MIKIFFTLFSRDFQKAHVGKRFRNFAAGLMERSRYFIRMAYDGQPFHGWQWQENAVSVQGVLQDALQTICRAPVPVVGCGRTDTGVHARQFYAHFELPEPHPDPEQLAFKLNCILPPAVAIYEVFPVGPEDHARFSALSRTYEYHLARKKNPFLVGRAGSYTKQLDLEAMQAAATWLVREADFSCFSKAHTQTKTNRCDITMAGWETFAHHWVFTIRANRFLRNMVRAIVGTLLEVGQGKMDLNDLDALLASKDRGKAGPSVVPEGLYLTEISYPAHLLKYEKNA